MTHEGVDVSRTDGGRVWSPSAQRVLADLTSERVSQTRDGRQLSYRVIWDAASISEAIRTSEGIAFLEGLIKSDGSINRYLIGLFLSAVSAGSLSHEARARLVPIIDSQADVTISPFHRSWELCPDSEDYLIESIESRSVVFAGDSILIKEKGRKAGLCIATTSTPNGTFLAGSWYEPIDQEQIKSVFKQKRKNIPLAGDWVHLNDISAYHTSDMSATVMREAIKYADRMR